VNKEQHKLQLATILHSHRRENLKSYILYFTLFSMISTLLSVSLIYHFVIAFLKLLGLHERELQASAGNLFQNTLSMAEDRNVYGYDCDNFKRNKIIRED
jgi:hypothetical protein